MNKPQNRDPLTFLQHLISLVVKEKEFAEETNKKLLTGPSQQLQGKGVAILNLKIIHVIPGLGGSCNLVLEVNSTSNAGEPVDTPQHNISKGDIVALLDFDLSDDKGKDNVCMSGIIAAISKTRIVLSVGCNIGCDNKGNQDDDESNSVEEATVKSLFVTSTDLYKIVKLSDDVTHDRMLKNLYSLQETYMDEEKKPSKLTRVLLGEIAPNRKYYDKKREKDQSLTFFDESLNDYQKEAIVFSLDAPQLSLIHGPPGTGKTHTLVELIRQLVAQNKTVLVCGASNVSVDNLVERTAVYCKNIVRIGPPTRVAPSSVPWTLDVLCCGKNSIGVSAHINWINNELNAKMSSSLSKQKAIQKDELYEAMRKIGEFSKTKVTYAKKTKRICNASVVFSTLSGCGSSIMRNKFFDVVIIDEAGQATEPDSWIALLKVKKAILAGDHLQLPPTVLSPPKIESSNLQLKGLSTMSDLRYTLFDRMLTMYGGKIKRLLSIQYRMNRKIMEYSSKQLYNNKLIAHKSVAGHLLHHLPEVAKTDDTTFPIITIDTKDTGGHHEVKGTSQSSRESIANDLEVKTVVNQIKKLLDDGLKQSQIAVITPYKAQVAKLRAEISEKWSKVEIGTVDGFQGKEKEAILLSLVRSNSNGEVGFLADKKRLNGMYLYIWQKLFTILESKKDKSVSYLLSIHHVVAMTRARRQLVVICDSVTLEGGGGSMNNSNSLPDGDKDVKRNEKLASRKSSFLDDTRFLEEWIVWLATESKMITSKAAFTNNAIPHDNIIVIACIQRLADMVTITPKRNK